MPNHLLTSQRNTQVEKISDKVTKKRKGLRLSLRSIVALGVALPIFLVLIFLSFLNYSREYNLLDQQARLDAVQLGELMIHSLNHAMLTKDGEHLFASIGDVSQLESVQQIQVVGISGHVLVESSSEQIASVYTLTDHECLACHQYSADDRPRVIPLEGDTRGWRISAPVNNLPECHTCHDPGLDHLGVLLMDISLTGKQEHLMADLRTNLLISFAGTGLVSVMSFGLVHQLVVRRIEALRKPLVEYAAGKFDARVHPRSHVKDELNDLSETFNHMANELARHRQEEEQRQQLRERAIIDERERIARELHDGFAQVLGYVNTKVMAVRLLVKKKRLREADTQLEHLEKAAKGLFVDVREAILGLKVAGQDQFQLDETLEAYIREFSYLSGIPTSLSLEGSLVIGNLSPEMELHLFRIIQESLNNIRKHSQASRAWVKVLEEDNKRIIEVGDNGVGFDQSLEDQFESGRLGLTIMRERADEMKAELKIHSTAGRGTRVIIVLPVQQLEPR